MFFYKTSLDTAVTAVKPFTLKSRASSPFRIPPQHRVHPPSGYFRQAKSFTDLFQGAPAPSL